VHHELCVVIVVSLRNVIHIHIISEKNKVQKVVFFEEKDWVCTSSKGFDFLPTSEVGIITVKLPVRSV